MPLHPLLHYLEQEIFFPVLNATADENPSRAPKLARIQQAAIDTLRDLFYPCTTASQLDHTLRLSAASPTLTRLWDDIATLGFPHLLDQSIQRDCSRLLKQTMHSLPPVSFAYSLLTLAA